MSKRQALVTDCPLRLWESSPWKMVNVPGGVSPLHRGPAPCLPAPAPRPCGTSALLADPARCRRPNYILQDTNWFPFISLIHGYL